MLDLPDFYHVETTAGGRNPSSIHQRVIIVCNLSVQIFKTHRAPVVWSLEIEGDLERQRKLSL